MSTAVLLIVLALQYQSMWGFFAFLVVLDIVSHWYQMVRTIYDSKPHALFAKHKLTLLTVILESMHPQQITLNSPIFPVISLSPVVCALSCLQYCKLMLGATTHKGSKNPLLNFYYVEVMSFWPRLPWLLIFCVGNEMFLVSLYMLSFSAVGTAAYQFYYLLAVISFPIFSAKQFFNVIQLADSASEIAAVDYEQHLKQ